MSPISSSALRQQIRNELLAPEKDGHSPVSPLKNDSSVSVAYLVNQIEVKTGTTTAPKTKRQDQGTPPPSPAKPPKRRSTILRRLSLQRTSSLVRTPSSERFNSLKSETTATPTPNASVDRIGESPSIPPNRRSSFTPGAATRKVSPIPSKQDIQQEQVIQEVEETEAHIDDEDCLEWHPPPPRTAGRAGTPSDFSYAQLGGLRHGSLQIVNGRASPTLSEASKVSKQLLAVQHPPHRDVSSEYGDVEEDIELSFAPSSSLPIAETAVDLTGRRFFSWEKNDDNSAPRAHPLQSVMSSQDEDHTTLMAEEYIAELGGSPFVEQRSSSPVGTIRRTRSEGSLWRASSCSSLAVSAAAGTDEDEISYDHPLQQSPSETGSVIHRLSEETTRGRSRDSVATVTERQRSDSAASWYSPDPSIAPDDPFQSAVEFQVQRSVSRLESQLPQPPVKSDSGYSSSNSLRSLQLAKRTPPPMEIEALPEVPDSPVGDIAPKLNHDLALPASRPSFLKSWKTSPIIPTLANHRPSVVSSNSVAVDVKPIARGSEASYAKPTKERKKLMKKKRPLSQPPAHIPVVRVQSFDEDHVPEVPAEARENLRVRSMTVPELDQAYVLPRLTGNMASTSTLDLSKVDLRFPSPSAEQQPPLKRSRSRSRPRSWFGRWKADPSSSRRDSGISQVAALTIINDFGSDGVVLGVSPYDFSNQSTMHSISQNPASVSPGHSRPRSMMNDETAAELSRRRSRSVQERESVTPERRPSFNDRGGIPGRNLRPTSFASDAPEITPEMLAKVYRSASQQRQPSTGADVPPPPPPHSPRPSYVDYGEYHDDAVPPPPPSHSPRPIDITPDPWAAQAAAWKVRRDSADRAFNRESGDFLRHSQHNEDIRRESLYPTIPPRQRADWTQYSSPEDYTSSNHATYSQYGGSPSREYNHYPAPTNSYGFSTEHESAYVRQSRRNSGNYVMQETYIAPPRSRGSSRHRPLPSPRPSNGPALPYSSSRPQSQSNSMRSFDATPAVDSRAHTLGRLHPPPAFGRYSGGMAFGYEAGNGFGGAAGTRSASSRADASRKGIPLRASYGVDLGDVPVGIMARG